MPLDDGLDDELDDHEPPFRAPLPPDDRIWRHPSELAFEARLAAVRPAGPWPVAVVAGLVGALLATALVVAVGGGTRTERIRTVVEREAVRVPVAARPGDWAVSAAERVRPAIVDVVVRLADGQSSASGVLFRDDGHILTNEHVVEGARRITVGLSDGRTFDAKVVGRDADTDVAVVKIDGGPFPVAALAKDAALIAGSPCVAIGSPLGLSGGPSVSVGVISALGRSVPTDGHRLYDMIQTDAAISPGSSGGALVDATGSVIGVTTAIAVTEVGAEGLGFATPIELARAIADQLIEHGRAEHAWIGVEGTDVEADRAKELGVDGGAEIRRVVDGGPADAAGIRAGDVVVGLDGRQVRTMSALVTALRLRRAGEVVVLDVVRGDERREARVTLRTRPAAAS